ncbi:hypothetical protein [Pontixanthobacter sp. CEM42]|uniref:hypothetical protein n=1 Tax=Pontixanthobacter sp. CEM42 TaxID=2792077 RepID=UPI001AE02D7D|nr:hypothetical protein [Pontixanthobacter sp. CEM42]
MLTFGGIGLVGAGIIFTFFADKIVSDPELAKTRKKQGPLLALVGAAFLIAAVLLGSVIEL